MMKCPCCGAEDSPCDPECTFVLDCPEEYQEMVRERLARAEGYAAAERDIVSLLLRRADKHSLVDRVMECADCAHEIEAGAHRPKEAP